MVKYEEAIKYVIKDASFAWAKLAVGIFYLGTVASFDGGMIILIQHDVIIFRTAFAWKKPLEIFIES